MLLRASRRRLQHHATFQSFLEAEPLQLPFLCPALYNTGSQTRQSSSQTRPPLDLAQKPTRSFLRSKHDNLSLANRGLASAAAMPYQPSPEPYIPFDTPAYLQKTNDPPRTTSGFLPLPGFDLNPSPLILDDTPTTSPGKFRSVDAISGDLNEIHQTLHACLQVGRLERAQALVRRLNQIYKPDAPGLLAAHKDYLREVTLRIIRTKDLKLLQDMLGWFEVEIRQRGIPQDASTFALVIQACLQDPNQKRCARAVRRYHLKAREAGVEEETKERVPEMESVLKEMAWYLEHRPQPAVLDDNIEQPHLKADQHPLPDLRSVDIGGQGLLTLRKSLISLTDNVTTSNADPEQRSNFPQLPDHERQLVMERNTVNAALERWRYEDAQLKNLGINSAIQEGSPLGATMWSWHEELVVKVKEEIEKANEAERGENREKADEERLLWGPYLQSISIEKISAVTILAAMNIMASQDHSQGTKIVHILHAIGRSIHEESQAEHTRRERRFDQWRRLSRNVPHSKKRSLARPPQNFNKEGETAGETVVVERLNWPAAVRFKVAAMLLSRLMEIARIDVSRTDEKTGENLSESRPVFFHTYQYQAGKRVGILRLNSVMLEKMSKAPLASTLAKYLPMICEPKTWKGFREGGFLEHNIKVVRSHDSDKYARRYIAAAAESGDMAEVFAGLDVLGKTGWKINRPLFDVMAQAWNSGKEIANIPAENPIVTYPLEPIPSEDARERRAWMKKVQEVENTKAGLRSERCYMNFQLEIARAFMNETFYLPHNCDFRGRAYPMAPFLNHMGADNARGLLLFANGKELGTAGLWWLKIHLANVYGYDKASFKERLIFTEEHLSAIQDSATNPLNGRRWWLEAEDPWQCLATCMELHGAMKLPNPTKFVSQLPVHQDGTCNGLQHYAALGGDVVGAKQVNLEPGDRPSDIYTGVSEIIKQEVKAEASNGHAMALKLDGFITRKVVKQTVMTNVYGVTFVGAKRQVRKQLENLLPDFPDTKEMHLGLAANYIARKIFKTLATMFNGAHDIQYWLGDCAGRICDSISPSQITLLERESSGQMPPSEYKKKPYKKRSASANSGSPPFITPVTWTTPLKMPVVQPYRKDSIYRVQTELQSLSLQSWSGSSPIDKSRQLQGFPPNFIHSLDGTHMFLTARACHALGLTFASVHDSFWTHAANVDVMNTVTRDAFIRMHSENIVARLAAEFRTRYKGHMQLASVQYSSFAGRKINEWRATHTKKLPNESGRKLATKTRELLLEVKRLRLLASQDAKEREEGENMITPASILAESAKSEHSPTSSTPDKLPTALGETKTRVRVAKLKANQPLEVGDLSNTETIEPEPEIAEEEKDDGKTKGAKKTWVWVPLTFPPVPEKGDFDVRRLRESAYFFS